MLAKNKIIAFVPTRDPVRARGFFEKKLGLGVVSEDPFAIVFDANGTMLRVVKVGKFTPFPFTILEWEVANIKTAAREMAKNGVVFEVFEGMKQDELGIWNSPGGAQVVWFKDADGNVLSISQH